MGHGVDNDLCPGEGHDEALHACSRSQESSGAAKRDKATESSRLIALKIGLVMNSRSLLGKTNVLQICMIASYIFLIKQMHMQECVLEVVAYVSVHSRKFPTKIRSVHRVKPCAPKKSMQNTTKFVLCKFSFASFTTVLVSLSATSPSNTNGSSLLDTSRAYVSTSE